MSLTIPTIQNAQFVATVAPSVIAPLTSLVPVVVPIKFANVANLEVITGSYTPANDQKIVATNLSAISPNFLMVIVDGLVVMTTDNSFFSNCPISKILVATMPPIVGGGAPMNSIVFDGRTILPYPMAQGVAVDYTIILGQAAIS